MLPAHPRVVRAAARDVPPRRDPDAGHDAVHGARHRPAHRARAGHDRRRRRRGGRQARDGARPVLLAAPRDRRRHTRWRTGDERYDGLRARASDAEPTARADARRRSAAPVLHLGHRGRRRRWCSTPRPATASGTRSPARFWLDLTPDDLHWTLSDTGWAKAAWGKLFGPWSMGACVVRSAIRAAGSTRRDACGVLRAPERDHLLRAAHRLPGDRARRTWRVRPVARCATASSAGEPLNPEVIDAWQRGAPALTIHDGYGQTETVVLVANFPLPRGAARARWASRRRATTSTSSRTTASAVAAGRGGRHRRPRRSPSGRSGCSRGTGATTTANAARLPRRLVLHRRPRGARRGRLLLVRRAGPTTSSSRPATAIGPFEVGVGAASSTRRWPSPPSSACRTTGAASIIKAFVVLAPGREAVATSSRASCRSTSSSVTAPYKYPREIEFVDRAAQDDQRARSAAVELRLRS